MYNSRQSKSCIKLKATGSLEVLCQSLGPYYRILNATSVCVVPCRSEFDQEECSTSLCASDFATLQRRGLLSPSWVATFRLPGCCFQEGMNGSSNRQHVWARGQGSDLKEASDFCQKLAELSLLQVGTVAGSTQTRSKRKGCGVWAATMRLGQRQCCGPLTAAAPLAATC